MGLLGLRKFIDSNGCTRLLPVPLSEEEEQELLQRQNSLNALNGVDAPYDDEEGEEFSDAEHAEGQPQSGEGFWQGSLTSSTAIPTADHVLVDMNCIVHSCFGKYEVANKSKKEIIHDILERLRVLVTKVVIPKKTLTICLDGPAPIAKLHTQRLRRRRVSLLDTGAAHQLTSLSITAGSLFMVELENALAAQFRLHDGRGFLRRRCPVFLHGSTVMGEGEAKISRALSYLAYQHDLSAAAGSGAANEDSGRPPYQPYDKRRGRSYGRHGAYSAKNGAGAAHGTSHSPYAVTTTPYTAPYNPNDSVVVLGNDIDLVMTCLGATFYHNISVVGPSSLQVINVGEIMYRWLKATSATHSDAARILPAQLASVRIDFMFLFLLNGGDHYVGAGDVAMGLWKRYRTVRAAYPQNSLVSKSLTGVDVDFLADVLNVAEYSGEAETETGVQLLEAALWSLYTTVTGECPDYRYVPPDMAPHIGHLRAAVARCQRRHKRISIRVVDGSVPLTPLETYVALMPTEAALPTGVAKTLRQPAHHALAQTLQTSNSASEIAQCAEAAVAASESALTVSEQYLRQFTTPVQLNVVPPAPRLSRHEQHMMVAKYGEVVLPQAVPVVQRIEMPSVVPMAAAGHYAHNEYPAHVQKLFFTTPFDAAPERGDASSSSGHVERDAAPGRRPRAKFIRLVDAHADKEEEEETEMERLEKTLSEPTMLRQQGKRVYSHKLKTMNRRLHRLQLAGHKRVLDEADEDKRLYALPRSDRAQESFLETLQQFLGDDMKAEDLVAADGVAAEVRARRRLERQGRKAHKQATKKAAPEPVKKKQKSRNKNKSARLRRRAEAAAAAEAAAKKKAARANRRTTTPTTTAKSSKPQSTTTAKKPDAKNKKKNNNGTTKRARE